MTVEYDPKIINLYASRLYIRALNIIVGHAFAGALFGAAGGYALGLVTVAPALLAWLVGVIGLLIGAGVGSSRALVVKLEAQTALCQVRIEENLRQIAVYQSQMIQGVDRQHSA